MSRPAFLHPFARPAAETGSFVRIVRGDGALVWDDQGREYVDALASLWYCNAGHGRAEIVDAVVEQMRKVAGFQCFDRFANEPADALCERLAGLAPMSGARVFLTCSGSEAVDSALKLARLSHAVGGAPERTVVISRTPSYHGVTFGGTSVTGLPLNQASFGPPLPDVVQVPAHDLDALSAAFSSHDGRVAAVIAEPVIGAGGVHPPAPGELEGMRRLCDEHGAFLILDEVICGFGRLGTWWAAQHYGVEPDLVTFAKAVTSGYLPVGGVLVGRTVLDGFDHDPDLVLRHGHTYSGHPASCAAALANLDILEREDLAARAKPIGERLAAGFRSLQDDGLLTGVRGDGAMWAAVTDRRPALEVRDRLLDQGVIARPIGADTVAFCPPLVITDAEIDRTVEGLAAAVR